MKSTICILNAILAAILFCGCTSVQESLYSAGIAAERLASGFEEASIAVANRKIAYLERPGSGETIVLLHGFGADKDNWLRFVRTLPKEYRIIAFDLPGHGESFKDPESTYTIDFITAGFSGAADALKLKGFHLVGNSMGGWVGMLYTARNPDRVITLGLFDTAGIPSPEPSDMLKALEKGETILVPTTEDAFITLMGYAFYKEPFIPWPVTQVLARKAVHDAPFRQKMWNDIRGNSRDASEILPDLRLPVLVIWGAADRITHVSAVQVMERYLPRSKTVVIPDCGHMPMLERPKETAAYYATFIKEQSPAETQ